MELFVFGFCVGVAVTVVVVFLVNAERSTSGTPGQRLPSGRISKDDTRCRQCGSAMKDSYRSSISARRFWDCPVCNYRDSYIDHDMVKAANQQQPG